ncbi:hypothetical protein BJY52DRAFT_1416187 [Lactarius psammicola]|nr:hypothetical protein BJY52DRAFT_1416187 [Lactarius psammicola]
MILSSNSPSLNQDPRTPSSSSTYRPHTSSPLSESFSPSPSASAAASLQSRRIAQYKSTATPTRRVSTAYSYRPSRASVDKLSFVPSLFSSTAVSEESENPRDALLRGRLRERCARRAQQARTKRVETERRKNALSSDGEDVDMDSDEENDEDTVLNDELFRRIIASASQKRRYSYRLSFQNEVGSSIDPDMEDIAAWERSLQGGDSPVIDESDLPPSEFDEDEIAERAAQAEEADLWAELELEAGVHDVFSFGDILDTGTQVNRDEDVDMT